MEWLKDFFTNLKDWLYEALLYIPQKLFDLLLQAILTIIESLPLPDFIVQTRLTDLISPEIMFFLANSGVGTALPIVGSGIVFYFFRRLLTVGIW
ncbi:MAG TPA: hypothetical protein VIM59_11305 [Cellvibrio sp.]